MPNDLTPINPEHFRDHRAYEAALRAQLDSAQIQRAMAEMRYTRARNLLRDHLNRKEYVQ